MMKSKKTQEENSPFGINIAKQNRGKVSTPEATNSYPLPAYPAPVAYPTAYPVISAADIMELAFLSYEIRFFYFEDTSYIDILSIDQIFFDHTYNPRNTGSYVASRIASTFGLVYRFQLTDIPDTEWYRKHPGYLIYTVRAIDLYATVLYKISYPNAGRLALWLEDMLSLNPTMIEAPVDIPDNAGRLRYFKEHVIDFVAY